MLSCKEQSRSLVITVTHKLPQSAAFIALFPIGPMPNPSAATVMGDTSQLLWHDLKPLLSATVTNEWAIQALLLHRALELTVPLLELSRWQYYNLNNSNYSWICYRIWLKHNVNNGFWADCQCHSVSNSNIISYEWVVILRTTLKEDGECMKLT